MQEKLNDKIQNNFESAVDYESIVKKDLGSYVTNNPFPHIVIDDFLKIDSFQKIIKNFPKSEDKIKWREKDQKNEDGSFNQKAKLVSADIFNMNINVTKPIKPIWLTTSFIENRFKCI